MSYDLQDLFPDQDFNADAAKHLQLDFDFSEFLNQDLNTNFEHSHVFGSGDLSLNAADFDFDKGLQDSDLRKVFDNNTTTRHGYDDETVPAAAGPSDTSLWDGLNASHHDTFTNDVNMTSTWHALNGNTAPSNPSASLTPPPSNGGGSQKPSPSLGTLPESSPTASPDAEPDSKKRKRERNTEAARRYRQRRQDRLEELEEALAAMTRDRDGLRLKLARAEAEADILRGLMAKKG